jgi:imidazolonepropionase-like amidohydrolase
MRLGAKRSAALLATVAAMLAGASATSGKETVRTELVIDHVTVVDVRGGGLARNRAIVIADGKITRIVAGGSVAASGAARIVEGHGAFVVPGYNDMHAHNLNTASPQTSLPLMLANGVTGFRQMAGADALLAARSGGTLPMTADSPALLAMPGTILAGPAFANPAAAKAEVDRQKGLGTDFIKVVDLPPGPFIASADEAHAMGLPFSGHLALTVRPQDAIAHHMTSIEHLGPTISLLLSCSDDEEPIRALLARVPPGAGGVDFNMEPGLLQRRLANPVLLMPSSAFAVIRRVLATYDEAKCGALAHAFAASDSWVVPTLTRLEAMSLGNNPALRDNPDLRYVPAESRSMWREVGQDFDARLTADQRKILADLYARQLKLARLFDQTGVKMMTGTDFGGQWIAPGVSLHREFDLLASTGIGPLRILQMTTIDPAKYLHREATMGTVEAGRNADLVLLRANPLVRSSNLHGITAVVRAGRFIDRAGLDAINARAEAALK